MSTLAYQHHNTSVSPAIVQAQQSACAASEIVAAARQRAHRLAVVLQAQHDKQRARHYAYLAAGLLDFALACRGAA